MERICVIGIYFGKLPNWFDLWLKSVEFNESIDFLLVIDDEKPEVPKNVKVLRSSLEEIKKLAEEKLEMKVWLNKPYKLCDFKPVWGKILEDYIRGYDYWGHCDFDMLFGDIRKFLEVYTLGGYDKFLSLGHLALYRNTSVCNNYYKLQGSAVDYKDAFTSDKACYFDEFNNVNGIYRLNNIPFFSDESIFLNINPWRKRLQRFDYTNYKEQVFYWENGKVYKAYVNEHNRIKIEEYLYIHICKRKLDVEIPNINQCNAVYITPEAFKEKEDLGAPSREDIRKFNPYHVLTELKENGKSKSADAINLLRNNVKKFLKQNRMGNRIYEIVRDIIH